MAQRELERGEAAERVTRNLLDSAWLVIGGGRRLEYALAAAGVPSTTLTSVGTLAGARSALLGRQYDAVVVGPAIPDAADLEAVTVMVAAAPDAVLLVATEHPADAPVGAALAAGADGHLDTNELDPRRLDDVLRRIGGSDRSSA